MHLQVFHDPSGRRGRWVRGVVAAMAVALVLALAGLGLAVGWMERRQAPALAVVPGTAPLPRAAALDPGRESGAGAWLPVAPSSADGAASGPLPAERIGFLMAGDAQGRRALAEHGGALSDVAVGLVSVRGREHAWVEQDDPDLAAALRAQPRLGLLLMIQNDGLGDAGWDGANMARLLADAAQRAQLLDRIERAMARWHARGLVLDLENLPPDAHGDYRAFLGEARARLAPRGQRLMIAAPVLDPAWDLRAYARAVDRVILMAYDQHWLTGRAGPIAGQPWFARAVADGVAAVGPGKAVVALGSYAYDWPDRGVAEPIGLAQAWQRAQAAGTTPRFDSRSGNSGFAYRQDGTRHQVWMIDALASWNQLQVLRALARTDAAPVGLALWRLGGEDPGFWAALAGQARDLALLPAPDGVSLVGQGEVLRIGAAAAPGWREAGVGADGLIRQAVYRQLPAANQVQRAGLMRKQVALTFDDGPDPRWTPQILAILKAHGVPATFFVTGSNALGEAGLLRAILGQGSELGNHSTTHPDLDRMGNRAVVLEINATQALVESYTGRSMRLFRAPYLGDADPGTAAELRVPRIAAGLGYLTVGLNVDPLDWTGADAATLVARTVAQVESGDSHEARQIVLLHDSGGDRSATVRALPQIIAQLQARGYRFVTVSALAGLSRDQAMPPLAGPRAPAAQAAGGLFAALGTARRVLGWLFVGAIVLGMARALAMTALALWQARRPARVPGPAHLVPGFVSVLIPAFNEARVIAASLRRVLESRGVRLEVIVIDDGSSDETAAVVAREFGHDPRVALLRLDNGGKARALNHGLQLARADVVIALDADTRFEPDTIARLAAWFADPAIGAVAGNARIGNRINLLTRWQAVEYVTAQALERRALDALGAVTVVPGAVGAWRRQALDEVGGYPTDTLAEDQDLTIAIQRAGWQVACDPAAVAWTEAPETMRALWRQRYRWAFGTLQCLWKHRAVLAQGAPRGLARFGLPQAWLFQVILGLLSPMIDLALLLALVDLAWRTANHGFSALEGDVGLMLGFWALFLATELGCGMVAYRLDGQQGRLPVLHLLGMRLGYRQLLYAVVVRAVFTALTGPQVAWGRQQRSGRFTVPPAVAPLAEEASPAAAPLDRVA
ncbi:glycosyltransferase [Novosphingobium sp. SG720]|uniref:glycosyltransferase n=1 Tax=Novosphingobium sp. SG720 TaxID=2586998 RepID=UPI0014485216|nr:glycosyltransferase [Novosphingobium sp. SG720]NKJ44283.1 peptidoglycan/xylan/chitin deacetylase (PgdA/CDA1 family)/GT2 family glycosyltransferase [Novosphingobium sp. SG720]